MKICIVSSPGGHLTEVLALKPCYERYEHFYVLNDFVKLSPEMERKTYFIRHSERDLLFLVNMWEAWKIFRKERPTLLLSAGAGAIVPFTLVGKLFGIKSVFVETFTRIHTPSMTAKLMYPLADRFFYQSKAHGKFFPKATYGGPLF